MAVGTTERPQQMPGHLSLTAGIHVLVFSGCVSQLSALVTKHPRSLTQNEKKVTSVCVCGDSRWWHSIALGFLPLH